MKIRSREINIVSMSALDMFCSALGAFMFLALLYSAFVPNLGPKAEEVAQMRQTIAEQKEELTSVQEQLKELLQQNATDIVIVVDGSGSMYVELSGLKSEIKDFAEVLARFSKQARIGVVVYRDRCLGAGAIEQHPLTGVDQTGVTQIKTFLDRQQHFAAPCNNDNGEEALYDGLVVAKGMAWSAEPANRHIVVIGDNGPYADQLELTRREAADWGRGGGKLAMAQVKKVDGVEAIYRELAQLGNGASLETGQSFSMLLLKAMAG